MKPTIWDVQVLTHTKVSGTALDGHDAVYSKGKPVNIEGLKAGAQAPDWLLLRLAKGKRQDLMITRLLTKKARTE